MRRIGCVPTLMMIAMSLALIAVAGVALSNTAVTLASLAAAAISQITLVAVLGGIILVLISSIALRDPLIRAIVARRAGLPHPKPPDLPAPAAPARQIQPAVKQIAIGRRPKRRIYRVPPNL